MKFDCIIMNPPYQKNLHLKILEMAIKQLKDENSVCVNLSPVRWLQDPLAKYKKHSDYNKFEDSVSKHIKNIDTIKVVEANNLFNIRNQSDIGIYVCNLAGGFDYKSLIYNFLIKIFEKQQSHIVFDINKNDGIRVRFPIVTDTGGSCVGRKPAMSSFGRMVWFENGKRDGKWWYDCYTHNQYTKRTETIPYSVKFNTKNEADNFCKQFNTKLCKVYTHLMKRSVSNPPEIVLWLGDATNPRTGLKGYEGEWTDEDLSLFFNILPEEQAIIEKEIEKYQ